MVYEVFIPAADEDGMNITLRVEASNWLAALRQGLAKIGEQGDIVKNVMCDIQDDDSIHVTDPKSGRVFRLKDLGGGGAAESKPDGMALEATATGVGMIKAADSGAQDIGIPSVARDPNLVGTLAAAVIETGEHHAIPESEAQIVEVVEERATAASVAANKMATIAEEGDILGAVFEEAGQIYDFGEDIQSAVDFVMDLAMSKIPAEAGAILFANINENDLYFAAARGPKAAEVMGYRVPMGKGIAGFVAREGEALTVSNASRSPLFFRQIADSIGYEARSIACAPIEHEGRSYGAIEVLNKTKTDEFTADELEAIRYLGGRLAEHVNQVIMSHA